MKFMASFSFLFFPSCWGASISQDIWPFLKATIEIDCNTSTEVTKRDVLGDACKIGLKSEK